MLLRISLPSSVLPLFLAFESFVSSSLLRESNTQKKVQKKKEELLLFWLPLRSIGCDTESKNLDFETLKIQRYSKQERAETMAEEHRFQAAEGHRLCANNCGFFGSPATLDLCSKCYRDLRLKEEQASSAKIAVEKSLNGAGVSVSPPSVEGTLTDVTVSDAVRNHESASASASASSSDSIAPSEPAKPNRCSTCRKRVGLTGFRCRCGATYCGSHRYPEQHGCGFDFKAAGRESIAKANPVVKAAKLDKI